jgi:Carboxypeptidase regulatory-like domain
VSRFTIILIALFITSTAALNAQTASLSGRVFDESGAAIPSAKVTITGPDRAVKTNTSTSDGTYSFTGLNPGNYQLTAAATGLATPAPVPAELRGGLQTLDLRLKVVVVTAQVNVQDNAGPAVSIDASTNASATVLTGDDLQSLSDDPEDLQADLEALAGPSAGPGGSAIFIDGFSGGQLPPKESIREVRINQNPFSPEYDKLGLGRVEIFTKPGTDKFHGTITYNLGADKWNSRNPYATQKAPFLLQETENSFSGPLSKHASFTLDLERQAVDNGSVTNVELLDPATLNPTPFTSVLKTPQRHTRIGPHIDYQINDNNYLSLRYTMTRADIRDAGIGSFDLISRGFHLLNTFNTVQGIETSLHGATLNETRFQYFRWGSSGIANTPGPEIQVLGAFNGGGASSSRSRDIQTSYELQNNTSIVRGPHAIRLGVRLRRMVEDSLYPQNFQGTFTFTSLAAYAAGTPSQFTRNAGTPETTVNQNDLGIFFGDDWRVRPNLTLNLGFRFESQTNISDHADYAPRFGLAWAPGATKQKAGKTVLRGGFGMFYDRFSLNSTLNADRYNGINQQQYIITAPAFYPNIPSLAVLGANPATQAIREVDSHLRAPYIIQSALTLERQLPKNTTLAVTYTNAHGLHELRTADINAPLPGTYTGPGTGIFPYPGHGPIFLMGSSGLYNQNQLIFNVNSKINSAVSVFSSYVLNKAMSNTDGLGTYPGNPYNYSSEYGPAATDVRHRFQLGGSLNTKWNIRFNPLISLQSGAPFNITSGNDPFGTTLYVARPGINAPAGTPGLVQTPYGLLDPNPVPGEALIGRNAGRGPGQILINLRVVKVWGFGPEKGTSGAASSRDNGAGNGGGLAPPQRPVSSNIPATRRYNISVGMSARNLINHNNPGPIIGNIMSPLFGQANQVAGSPNGEGFSENASNRRLELQIRFTY